MYNFVKKIQEKNILVKNLLNKKNMQKWYCFTVCLFSWDLISCHASGNYIMWKIYGVSLLRENKHTHFFLKKGVRGYWDTMLVNNNKLHVLLVEHFVFKRGYTTPFQSKSRFRFLCKMAATLVLRCIKNNVELNENSKKKLFFFIYFRNRYDQFYNLKNNLTWF